MRVKWLYEAFAKEVVKVRQRASANELIYSRLPKLASGGAAGCNCRLDGSVPPRRRVKTAAPLRADQEVASPRPVYETTSASIPLAVPAPETQAPLRGAVRLDHVRLAFASQHPGSMLGRNSISRFASPVSSSPSSFRSGRRTCLTLTVASLCLFGCQSPTTADMDEQLQTLKALNRPESMDHMARAMVIGSAAVQYERAFGNWPRSPKQLAKKLLNPIDFAAFEDLKFGVTDEGVFVLSFLLEGAKFRVESFPDQSPHSEQEKDLYRDPTYRIDI